MGCCCWLAYWCSGSKRSKVIGGLWNKLQILCDKQNKWSLFLILFFSGGGGRNRKKLVCHLVICSAWFKGQSLALFCFVLSTTITAHTCTWRFKIIFCTYFWIKELHFITEKEFFLKKGQIVGGVMTWKQILIERICTFKKIIGCVFVGVSAAFSVNAVGGDRYIALPFIFNLILIGFNWYVS